MMVRLLELLSGETPAGVFRYRGRAATERLCAAADRAGWRCFRLDGAPVMEKAALLDALAGAADFPDYCGSNWDAVEECLRDLSWAPASGYLLVWEDARVLARSDPRSFRMAEAVLTSVSDHWQERGVPFVVLLRGTGPVAS